MRVSKQKCVTLVTLLKHAQNSVHVRKGHECNYTSGDISGAHMGKEGGENGEQESASPKCLTWLRETINARVAEKGSIRKATEVQ